MPGADTHLELGASAAGGHSSELPWPASRPLASLAVLHLLLMFPEGTPLVNGGEALGHTPSITWDSMASSTLFLLACNSLSCLLQTHHQIPKAEVRPHFLH